MIYLKVITVEQVVRSVGERGVPQAVGVCLLIFVGAHVHNVDKTVIAAKINGQRVAFRVNGVSVVSLVDRLGTRGTGEITTAGIRKQRLRRVVFQIITPGGPFAQRGQRVVTGNTARVGDVVRRRVSDILRDNTVVEICCAFVVIVNSAPKTLCRVPQRRGNGRR